MELSDREHTQRFLRVMPAAPVVVCIGAETLQCTQVLLNVGKLINYAGTRIQQTFTIKEVWRKRE